MKIIMKIGCVWVLAVALLTGCVGNKPPLPGSARLIGSGTQDSEGYARVTAPIPLLFPADHGAHSDYQTEWWYFTGNVQTEDGREFGFQLTFFRRALAPPQMRSARTSKWATDQAYLAHFALTDVKEGQYQAFERLSRGAAGLAGADGKDGLHVWLENWSVEQKSDRSYELTVSQEDLGITLNLNDLKGVVMQGDRGYSQKGPDAGNASMYYSLPRLAADGWVVVKGKSYAVKGNVWMDHEFSTSALSTQQVGWDWFALQLDDGAELMVYQLRRADGSLDPFSSGLLVRGDGSTRRLSRTDFDIRSTGTWRSPLSGAVYPADWRVTVPTEAIDLTIQPKLANQELNLTFTYWEGAVKISGSATGSGYVELTGYAGSMAGQF